MIIVCQKTNTTPANNVCNFFCSVSLNGMKAIANVFILPFFKNNKPFLTSLLCGGLLQLPDLTVF